MYTCCLFWLWQQLMLSFILRGESRKCLFFLLNLEVNQMQELVGEPGRAGGFIRQSPACQNATECHSKLNVLPTVISLQTFIKDHSCCRSPIFFLPVDSWRSLSKYKNPLQRRESLRDEGAEGLTMCSEHGEHSISRSISRKTSRFLLGIVIIGKTCSWFQKVQ